LYGLNVLLRRGGSYWIDVDRASPRISAAMRLALADHPPDPEPGSFTWREVAQGFEVAEMPVLGGGQEIDRMLLARIDPTRYRFVVRNAAAGDRDIDDWMRVLGAAMVINGSYYGLDGTPATPFVSEGIRIGPDRYDGRHGVFAASNGTAMIRDLARSDWREAFKGADNAMVSYPMLVAPDPEEYPIARSKWLANRSFVGQDASGKIIVGTTRDAFFSLARLAAFLRAAPLGLTLALNLDGGPVACQGIDVGGYKRVFRGEWESQEHLGRISLLRWPFGTVALPIVLAAIPR